MSPWRSPSALAREVPGRPGKEKREPVQPAPRWPPHRPCCSSSWTAPCIHWPSSDTRGRARAVPQNNGKLVAPPTEYEQQRLLGCDTRASGKTDGEKGPRRIRPVGANHPCRPRFSLCRSSAVEGSAQKPNCLWPDACRLTTRLSLCRAHPLTACEVGLGRKRRRNRILVQRA